jgi:hypothetical protein
VFGFGPLTYRGWAAAIMSCLSPVAVKACEFAWRHRSSLVAIKDGGSIALRHVERFTRQQQHEDEKHTYIQLSVYREMEIELSVPTKTKYLQHKSCVKRYAEATREKKLNDGSCAMNLTNSVKTLQSKLKIYTKRNSKPIVRMDSSH